MNINIFTFIGQTVVVLLVILLILTAITAILGIYLLKNNKLIFPKILLFTLNITSPVLKKIIKFLNFDDIIVDKISINLRNKLNKEKFKKLKAEDVIIILPHCLRSTQCPAKLTKLGLECINCGNCCINEIKKISQKKGINLYIVPGSTFIKNITKIRSFKGIIGVACPIDLNQSMTVFEKFIPQGVYLLKDGCINTIVNPDEIIDLINKTLPKTNYSIEN